MQKILRNKKERNKKPKTIVKEWGKMLKITMNNLKTLEKFGNLQNIYKTWKKYGNLKKIRNLKNFRYLKKFRKKKFRNLKKFRKLENIFENREFVNFVKNLRVLNK